ncbi:glycosyltransferase [Rhizobium sp. Leaf341]|uniref:glycosyltransferase n=1 Tax=Rhizobium sp. Leaf341 TaxID=1736344 RepID=UPI0009EC98D7|nr:glycosyltransferase [Rhizobium sp. Leaf341]
MKILHVCETIIGGTGSYLAELVPHQVTKYGIENVSLLVPDSHLQYIDPKILSSGIQIATFRRPRRLSGAFMLARRYLQVLKSVKPDIVHAHSSIAGAVVRVARGFTKARIIFCAHGWSMDMTGTPRTRKLAELVERGLAIFPDQIIVISSHELGRALKLGIPFSRLSLVPNGIDATAPAVEPAAWVDDRIKVLYAGRFDYQKGVDVLIEAVRGLDDKLSVRLVGDNAVSRNVLPEPLPDCIVKLGWLDRNGVTAQMKSCDVLVVPSRWEGFGLVAIEAMRLSKPVIVSAVGGLQEIVDHGKYGYLVEAENVAQLHERLRTLDKASLKEMGAIGYQRFASTYTADRMVRQIDAVYAGRSLPETDVA